MRSKGIDWDAQPLGKMADIDIAAALDVNERCVRNQRKKRGIAPWGRRQYDLTGVDLRQRTDAVMAQTGAPRSTVQLWRERAGITDYERMPRGANLPHRRAPDVSNAFATKRANELRAGGMSAKRAAMVAAHEYLVKWSTVYRRMRRGAYAVDVTASKPGRKAAA